MREEVSSSALVRVWLLGEFQVERRVGDDAWEEVKRDEWDKNGYAKRLLKRLLCMPRRRAQRTSIIDDLWPSAEIADDYLNKAASRLRKILQNEQLFRTLSSGYELADQPLLWTDIDACYDLMHEIERIGYTSVSAHPLLQRAIAHFERGSCLEGDGGQWCYAVRLHVEQAAKSCRLWLAEAYEAQGMQWHARTQLRSLLEGNPMDEDILYHFMGMLHRNGKNHDALSYYEQAKKQFKEYGLSLSERTQKMAERIAKDFPLVEEYYFTVSRPEREVPLVSRDSSFTLPASTITAYNGVLSLCWSAYYSSSAQQLAATVGLWIQHLDDSLDTVNGVARDQLLSLLCKFYQISGVIARDRLDFQIALAHAKKSIQLAFALGNPELIASALYRCARHYVEMRHYDLAKEHLERALPYAKRSRDPLRCYTSICLAETYSLLAPTDAEKQKDSLSLLDEVGEILQSRGTLDGDGSFVKVDVPGWSMVRGDVLRRFGRLDDAEDALIIVRSHLPRNFVRWRGNLLVAEAELHYELFNVESCCKLILDALDILEETQSASIRLKIEQLYVRLHSVSPSIVAVQSLGERLTLRGGA